MVLPGRSWDAYEDVLRGIGEHRQPKLDLLPFLRELKLVDGSSIKLTPAGEHYFADAFIRGNQKRADVVLHDAMCKYTPALVVCQLLEGVALPDRAKAETILRSQGFHEGLSDRSIGSLLTLMDRAGLVKYNRKNGQLTIIARLSHAETVPSSVFVSPQTPYGNKVWLRRILEEGTGYIHWFDKHFMSMAFDALWEAADANRVKEIKILSLKLESNSSRRALNAYKDLKRELATKGINLEWRVIDSTEVRGTHDRWIISEKSARNIPDVGTIYSGNHAELSESHNYTELQGIFNGYWLQGEPIVEV